MKTVALADFCDIVAGGRKKWTGKDFVEHGYPAYGAGGLNGYLQAAEFDRPAVVLSSIGARCGKCFIAEGEWSSLANTQLIFPDTERADPRFLWFQLNDEARWPRAGTGQPFIKPSSVKAHMVYLPPIEEQRRIAAVLDAADALRAKRRQALAKLDTLTQAIFIDMFVANADPGWMPTPVSELADSRPGAIRTGPFGSQLLHEEFSDEGPVAVLGIDNAVQNRFVWGERRFISNEKYQQLKRYTVRPGDVLVTIMGTCGRAAIVPEDIPVAINTKHLCCITLDLARCRPEYLWASLRFHPAVLRQLGATRGAVMPGLNMGLIKQAKLPLPPPELQDEFARRKRRAEQQLVRAEDHAAELDRLFGSLQQRAFREEL